MGVARGGGRTAVLAGALVLASCGAAPVAPPASGEDGNAGDAARILTAIVTRDGAAMSELSYAHGVRGCGTTGRAFQTCAGALLAAAARTRGLDQETRSLYETLSNGDAWFQGPVVPRALARAIESDGPVGGRAAALMVARAAIVLDLLDIGGEANRALLFATGVGVPCPEAMAGLTGAPPQHRRALLVEAGCVPAGEDTATEAPEGLAARAALDAVDAARRRLAAEGGALADAVLATFEPRFNALRIPLPLATTMAMRGGALTLPEVDAPADWKPPVAILTVLGASLHVGEPPWLGGGPGRPARHGTLLPGPRTTLDALGDDLVQVIASLPPDASGEASSGPVLIVADARESAANVAAALSGLSSLPDAPAAALAVRAVGGQSQIALVGPRETETPVGLRVMLAERSATIVASGIELPAERDLDGLGRLLDQVRTTFPNEHMITVVPGAEVPVMRLVEVLRLAGAPRRFDVVRLAPR